MLWGDDGWSQYRLSCTPAASAPTPDVRTGRWKKFDRTGGGGALLCQSKWKSLDCPNLDDLAHAREDHSQEHCAGNLIAPCLLGVVWFGFRQETRSLLNFRRAPDPIRTTTITRLTAVRTTTTGLIFAATHVSVVSRSIPRTGSSSNAESVVGSNATAFTGTF